jgi:prepilin-type N-terminal cleavage/methylation domain-containing protein
MGKQKTGQHGFSLMELMIALTIMGILAVIGMRAYQGYTHQARHMKAFSEMREVAQGLAEFNMKTGSYPELSSWEAMVTANSILVTRSMVRVDIPINDPWGNPYEGKSTKGTYELKCAGKPDGDEETGPIIMTPNGTIGGPAAAQQQGNRDTQTAPPQQGPASQ